MSCFEVNTGMIEGEGDFSVMGEWNGIQKRLKKTITK